MRNLVFPNPDHSVYLSAYLSSIIILSPANSEVTVTKKGKYIFLNIREGKEFSNDSLCPLWYICARLTLLQLLFWCCSSRRRWACVDASLIICPLPLIHGSIWLAEIVTTMYDTQKELIPGEFVSLNLINERPFSHR